MARKVNKTVVGLLTILFVLAVVVCGFVAVKNVSGNDPVRYAEDAARREEKGDFGSAGRLYRRAYTKDQAKNPEYLVGAARCALAEGDVGDAYGLIQLAQVEDSKLKSAALLATELQFELAELFGSSSRWQSVLDVALRLQEIDPESVLAHHALGSAYLKLSIENKSYVEKGEAALNRALDLDPTNVKAARLLMRHYFNRTTAKDAPGVRRQPDEWTLGAEKIVARTLQKCEASGDRDLLADAKLLEAELALRQYLKEPDGRPTGVAMLEKLANLEPDRVDCYVELGGYYAAVEKDVKKATEFYEKALEIDPTTGAAYLALGQLYVLADQTDRVEPLYEKGLESIEFRKHFRALRDLLFRAELIHRLCMIDLRRARNSTGEKREAAFASAERRMELLKEEQGPASVRLTLLRAHMANARGEYVQAIQLAEDAEDRAASAQLFELKMLLGELYIRQQAWGAARDALVTARRINPTHVRTVWLLGEVYLKLGQPEETIRVLTPNLKDLKDALLDDPAVLRLRMAAYQELGQFGKAEQENQRLASIESDTGATQLRRAKLLLREERYQEAEEIIASLLEVEPPADEVVSVALFLYQTTDRLGTAQELVDSLVAKFPENREYQRFALSLARQGDKGLTNEDVEVFFAGEDDPFVKAMALYGWNVSRGENEKAVAYLDEAEKLQPENSGVLDQQFSLALIMGDLERAERYAARHAELNIDGTEGKISYGRLAGARGNFDEAIETIRAGLEKYPSHSMGHTYLGIAALRAGRFREARGALEEALKLDPTNGLASKTAAQVAASEGDEKAEETYLRAAARTLPGDEWVTKQLRILDERNDPESGIASREEIRHKEPKNVRNLIRLARLYREIKQFDTAVEVYMSAIEASKEDAEFDEILVAREVARFLGSPEVGRPAEGEALLEELQRARDDSADKARITMILGFYYEEQKRLSKAERLIRMAVSFDDSVEILLGAGEFFGRIFRWSDSLEFYERAMKAPNADRRAIQGRIISLLLAQQDLERLPAEIEAYSQNYPNDPQALIFQGTFHMMGGDIEKAEKAFSAELESNPNNPVALWQRGQLYVLKGRWRLAIEDLTKAKSYEPDGFSYRHRISLAEALLGAGRGDDAVAELKSILVDHEDEVGVASALAGLYVEMTPSRFGDAEYLITTYMKRNPADESWPLRLGKLGELSQDWDTAIEGYEKAAEVSQYRSSVVESLFFALQRAQRPEKVIQFAEQQLSERRLASMPKGLATLGWAYAATGRKEAALAAFDRAMAAAANDFSIHADVLAEMMSTFGRDEVKARIQARDDDDIHQRKVLLQLLYLRRDITEAEEVANLIIQQAERESDKLFAYVGLAALQDSTQRFDEARENYEIVLRMDPDNTFALNNLSYMLSEKFDAQKEALPYAERAAKLSPRSADVLDTLGWVLFKNGRTGEAVTRLLQALDIDSKNIAAMYHLGVVYKERGERQEAKRWLDNAKKKIEESPKGPDGTFGAIANYLPMIEKALGEMN